MPSDLGRWFALFAVGAFACDNSNIVANRNGDGGNAGVSGSSASGSGGDTGTGVGGENPDSAGAAGTAGTDSAGAGGSPDVDPGGAGSGAADTIGGAGSGGAADSPSADCDDGDTCTEDSFDGEACQHDPVADGERCEDGVFCTLGDRCMAGVCNPGAPTTGAAKMLGTVEAYGTGPGSALGGGYSGTVLTLSDDRFVFVDEPYFSPRLTQTRVVGGLLETFDELDVTSLHSTDPPVATAWDDFIAIASDTASIQIGGDPRLLQIVSVSPAGQLTLRGTVPFAGDAFTSMAGRGQRLFVCTNFSFFTPPSGTVHWVDVADPDAPFEEASAALGVGCGSMVVSEDGNRVYVNTANGVRFSDLSTYDGSGDLIFDPALLVSVDSGLALRGNDLLMRSGETVHILDEGTHDELSSFSVAGAHAAGFTDAGIFVQGDRANGGGRDHFIALYTESGDLLHEQTVMTYAWAADITSAKPAVGGTFVAVTMDQQIFEVTSSGFTPIEEPSVGGLFHLFAGKDALLARGRTSTTRIDLTDPKKPVIVAGGPNRSGVYGIKLDESLRPAVLLPEYDPSRVGDASYSLVEVNSSAGHASATNIQRVTVDATEHDLAMGSIELPGGDAFLLSAGDFLYRVANGHFQRWLTSDLQAGVSEPALDIALGIATGGVFDVDPQARMAIVLAGSELKWIDLSTDPPAVTTAPLTGYSSAVKLRGNRAAIGQGSGVSFIELGSTDAEFLDTPNDAYLQDVLAFDGNAAYLSSSIPGGNGKLGGPALQVVKRGVPADQALVAEIRMPAVPTSLVAMDNSLAVGSAVQVLTISPQCE